MGGRFRRSATYSAVAGVALLLTGACSSPSAPIEAKKPRQDPTIPYTHVWSADAGTDLFSRGAELVRGTAEAGYYTRYVGVDRSYPGYNKAVGAPVSWHNEDKTETLVWSDVNDPAKPGLWTFYDHITNYAANDSHITADVCSYNVPEAAGKSNGPWVLNDSVRIQLTNTEKTPGAPGIPDDSLDRRAANGHRSPNWNIFGTWQVTHIKRYTVDTNPAACVDWWLQQFPGFARSPYGNFVTSPPDFQRPNHPVAVQYPEWIGPSGHR